MDRACFLCGRPASWRGVIGTRRTYVCDDDKGRLQLLVSKHPFQSQIVVRPVSRTALPPVGPSIVPSLLPAGGDLEGDAA